MKDLKKVSKTAKPDSINCRSCEIGRKTKIKP